MNPQTLERTDTPVLELQPRPAQPLAPAPAAQTVPVGELSVVQYMIQSGATPEQVQAALELQVRADNHKLDMLREKRRMDEEDRQIAARSAYYAALAKFKAKGIRIIRDKDITDGPLKGKKHATVSSATTAVTEALSEFGLSATWRTLADEKDWIKIACVIKHVDGFSEEVPFGGPVDTGPGRNAIQARKSTVSYLERITLELALGLAEHDDDDDGRGAGGGQGLDADEETLLNQFRDAALDGEKALREFYDKNVPSEEFWKKYQRELKEAAKRIDRERGTGQPGARK